MPDDRRLRLLVRLLPSRAREWFEPAWHDLEAARLDRLRRQSSGVGRAVVQVWGWLQALTLLLDCWRLAFLDRHLAVPEPRSPRPRSPEPLDMFVQNLRHAFRRLLREPSFTAAAVLTLGLGVGANVAVFAVVEAVLLRPLPYPDADRLVILNHRDLRTGVAKEFIAIGDFVDLAARQSTFADVAGYGTTRGTIFDNGEPFQVSALMATSRLFDALEITPLFGRALTPEDAVTGAGRVALMGYDLWKNRFGGDSAVVGRSIRFESGMVTIVGVMPPQFRFPPNSRSELVVSMEVPTSAPAQRKFGWTFALGRLAPGKTVTDATADLAAVSRQLAVEYPAENQGSTYFALPLRDAVVGDTKMALIFLLAAVGVVLLIACANVANLLLARSLGRRREMAVRATLGAGRRQLAGQLLTESLVLALVAGVVGVTIASQGTRALVTLLPAGLIGPGLGPVGINGPVLVFALGLTVLATVAFGLAAIVTTRKEASAATLVVAGRSSMTAGARRASSALVVAEISLAVVLLIGAGLILRSFAGLLAVDPGFRTDQVMTVEIALPADRYADPGAAGGFYDGVLAAIADLPTVRDVGAGVVVPLTGNNWTAPLSRADQPVPPGERPPEVGWQMASGGFFRALEIPLRAGRLFDRRDRPGSPQVAIVSEAVERKYFTDGGAVGRILALGEQRVEIVGVVGDIRRAGLTDAPRADMYFPFEQNPGPQITLFVRTTIDPAAVGPAIKEVIRRLEPNTVFLQTRTLAAVASESVRTTRLLLWLLGVFAVIALVLAAVGIYGVMSYVVRQRTREIGTRLALGATGRDIVWMVMREGGAIAAIGVVVGAGVGLAAARGLSAMLYGVSVADPLVVAAAVGVLVATALVSCYLPARRAAAVDPARTLMEQ
jgi:predicted permease